MDILVLGGTVFLSRAVAATAHAHGHNVTVFNRGRTGEPVPGVQTVLGDRDDPESLRQLAGREFDLVFDTAYVPDQVKASAELLEPTVKHYVYTSSISVYPAWPEEFDYAAKGTFDGDPDAAGDQVPDGLVDAQPYGWRKVGAERALLRVFGEHRSAILRAGSIAGPFDTSGRLPWWLDRISRGGPVVAPGRPDRILRMVDARDIAEFALRLPVGTFEVTGPQRQVSYGQLFDEARRVTGSDAEFRWIDEQKILAAGVEEWTQLPLWAAESTAPGLWAHHTEAAEAAGLACRPMLDTVIDTWQWMQGISGGWQPAERTPGLPAEIEATLLAG